MAYFIILYLILYFILSWQKPDWALMLILATLPSYLIRFSVFGIPTTLLETMIIIIFTVFIIKNYRQIFERIKTKFTRNSTLETRNLKRYPFDIEIILLLIISWVAVIIAGVTDSSLGIWKAYFFEPVLIYILIFNIFKSATCPSSRRVDNRQSTIDKILWFFTISALLVSLIAIFQKLTGLSTVEKFLPRVTGPFPYPNALGLYLGPLILIMIGWLLTQRPKLQITNYKLQINFKHQIPKFSIICLTITLSILSLFLASSEGALAGILISIIICGLFLLFKNKTKWIPISLTVLIIIFAFAATGFFLKIVPEYKYYNFESKTLNYATDKLMLKDISGEIRKQQWRETWTMLNKNYRWLIGTGLANYQPIIKPYHQEGIFFNFERDPEFRTKIVWFDEEYKAKHWQPVEIYMYPHNILLNFWTELGLAGALLFIWIFAKIFYLQITNYKLQITNNSKEKNNSYITLGLLGAIIVIIVHGIVDVPYFKNDLAVMFWILIAITGIINVNKQDKKIS